ncbi:MAG: carboxylesterase family protein [Kofleriaceae bacterium]
MTVSRWLGAVALVVAACGGGGGDGEPDAAGGDADGAVDAPAAACTPTAGAAAERVATTSGVVRGAMDGATWAYKGVPFAAPPVGPLRLRAPLPATCAPTELDATQLGPRCPQLDGDVFVGDEDCLQLNVWAPAAGAAPRPVMVWIHGGANMVGSAADPIYDGRRLAEAGDAVVVTINYRLGQLGFLADAALEVDGSVGNYGILDQVQALAWVQANIAAFGGDPGNVMVFGESAGARNTCTLLAVPAAAGLFHRALMQSGACKFVDSRVEGQATADAVAADLGCTGDRAACLRAATPEAMVRANFVAGGALSASIYGPVVDGVVLTEQPEAAIRAGRHHAMPFAIGANADETGREAPTTLTEAQYTALVRSQLGPTIGDRALAQYPASAYPSPRAAYVRLTTDARFVCPSREIADGVRANQSQPVFRYFFTYRASLLGAVHGVDVPYVFGTFSAIIVNGQPYQPSATDLALSAAIQGYWTRFARAGDPGGAPAWPRYDAADPAVVLDQPVTTTAGVRTADCDFWKPYYLLQ